jgi:RNA-binding protein YlmH
MLMVVIPVQAVALVASNVGDFLCRLLEEIKDSSVRLVERGQSQAKQKN